MPIKIITIAALIILAIPVACLAMPARPGGYIAGFVGVTIPGQADITTNDFSTGRFFNNRVEYDPGFSIGGTGGYDFGYVRLEGELSYKQAEIHRDTDLADGFRFGNVNGSTGALAMMANLFFDMHNASQITPYLGGGIGFANLYQSNTYGTDNRGGTIDRVLLYPSDSTTVFAYQAGAGLEIGLNRNLSIDLGYRYFATGKGTLDRDPTTEIELDFESHNANIGIRMRF
ncbi:MAG TPA: outer membrane beta-barrel protein [Desulfuromonadaceae bacterium]|jgi:opacity protein-like surface antigen